MYKEILTYIFFRCTELTGEKQKLNKTLREKEDELNQTKQKLDVFKMEFKKIDKNKKDLESKIDAVQTDLAAERRQREEANHTVAQLEKEVESLKSGGRKSLIENDLQIEIARYGVLYFFIYLSRIIDVSFCEF